MDAPYTPFYCEENVYQLLHHLSTPPASSTSRFSRLFAAFISNPSRQSLLFRQKASRAGPGQGEYVIWDYHVAAIGVESEGGRTVVLDRDSTLGGETELGVYVQQTFRPDLFKAGVIDPRLQSRIRIVPAALLLTNFASDRSHMLLPPALALDAAPPLSIPSASSLAPLTPPPTYARPPPSYPPIQGSAAKERGEKHNLWTHWLDVSLAAEEKKGGEVEEVQFGEVLSSQVELLQHRWLHP